MEGIRVQISSRKRYDIHMSQTRAIASSTLWQLGSQIVMAMLSIITTKFVAVGLSQELAGHYNTAYGYLQLFGILADFGLYAVAVREVSRAQGEEREKVLGALLILRSIILALSLGTAITFVWLYPHWNGTPLPLSVTIAATVPLFTLLAGVIRTAFQVHYRMHFVFIAEVTQRVITTAGIGAFVVWGVRGTSSPEVLYAFLGIGGIGALVLFLLSISAGAKVMRIRPNFDGALLWHLLKQCAPYGIAYACTALYRQFDVTLIAMLRPQDFEIQNAYYGFVQRMMDMAYLLPTFLMNSTLPILSENIAKKNNTQEFLGKILLAILLLSTVSFLFAFFWSRPLMQLLTTEQYLSHSGMPGSDTALGILAYSMGLNGLIVFAFYALLAVHRWRPLVLSLLVAVGIAMGLNIVLIPVLGFVGASITSVFVHAFLALTLFLQSQRALPAKISTELLLRWLGFAAVLGITLWFLAPFLTSSILTALGLAVMTVWMLVLVKLTQLHTLFLRS